MLTPQNKLDLFASVLLSGNVSPERQVAIGRELAEIGIEHRKLTRFRDEIVMNAQEDADLAHAVLVSPPDNVTPFPRRPPPVRLATPSVVAVDWSGESVL